MKNQQIITVCKNCGNEFKVRPSRIGSAAYCSRSCYKKSKGAKVDHQYFDNIDCEEKAYWLGFFTADGTITSQNVISISLHVSDVAHLEKFRSALTLENKVKTYSYPYTYKDKTEQAFARVTVTSQQLTDALANHGIHPRKSWSAKPTILAAELMRHYWRGLIDGDGSISWNMHKGVQRPKLQFCGTFDMVAGFADFCRTIRPTTQVPISTKWEGHYRVSFSDRLARSIAIALYEDATIYLERKMQTVITFKAVTFQQSGRVRRLIRN